MRSGRLKWRLTVRRATTTRDAMNAPVDAWADAGSLFVERVEGRAAEAAKAGQTAAQVETVWRGRWTAFTATISATDRFVVDGVEYRVGGVTEPERRRTIQIVGIADV